MEEKLFCLFVFLNDFLGTSFHSKACRLPMHWSLLISPIYATPFIHREKGTIRKQLVPVQGIDVCYNGKMNVQDAQILYVYMITSVLYLPIIDIIGSDGEGDVKRPFKI